MLKWRIALLIASFGGWGVVGQSENLTPSTTTTNNASPITAPASSITKDPFVGFVIVSATTKPIYCPDGQIFTTSSKYAGCCASTASSCAFATGCEDNAMIYSKGVTSNCGPMNCQTRQIFPTYGIGDPALMPLCASSGEVNLLYRTVPTTSRLALPLTAADTTGALATRPPMMVSVMNEGGAEATGQGANGAKGSDDLSPKAVGIIVGSVFGSMAIILLGAVAFFYGRRQEREKRAARNGTSWKMPSETPGSWDRDSIVSVAGSKRGYSSPYRTSPIELSPMPRGRR
ncbi:uncharacterized protein F4812DRAFT_463710 [Daldinia caldariorum]|uniref:uncharacterized protein n=1 Tax=Daldinia caldariorum TaxID=326644 RepID=UPI00200740C1|nr:uncharacterized protein F4812DRAFT_463710 [Daldinia caldariorum]KAI1463375.1 hypothetical protein F4812DRAFT_463710 [Daldinia caldariorum]